MSKILLAITALAWTALIVEGFVDTLSFKGFAVLCVVAALAPALAMVRSHSMGVQRTTVVETRDHAERMERVVERIAALASKQEALAMRMDSLLDTGLAQARLQATERNGSAADTGPFPLYNRHN